MRLPSKKYISRISVTSRAYVFERSSNRSDSELPSCSLLSIGGGTSSEQKLSRTVFFISLFFFFFHFSPPYAAGSDIFTEELFFRFMRGTKGNDDHPRGPRKPFGRFITDRRGIFVGELRLSVRFSLFVPAI